MISLLSHTQTTGHLTLSSHLASTIVNFSTKRSHSSRISSSGVPADEYRLEELIVYVIIRRSKPLSLLVQIMQFSRHQRGKHISKWTDHHLPRALQPPSCTNLARCRSILSKYALLHVLRAIQSLRALGRMQQRDLATMPRRLKRPYDGAADQAMSITARYVSGGKTLKVLRKAYGSGTMSSASAGLLKKLKGPESLSKLVSILHELVVNHTHSQEAHRRENNRDWGKNVDGLVQSHSLRSFAKRSGVKQL